MSLMTRMGTSESAIIDRMFQVDWNKVIDYLRIYGTETAIEYLSNTPKTPEYEDLLASIPNEKIFYHWNIWFNRGSNGNLVIHVGVDLSGLHPALTVIRLALW